MTARVVRDTASFCPTCRFTSKRTTAGLARRALQLHSCARHIDLAAKRAHGDELRARQGVRRDCRCPRARHQHGDRNAYVVDHCRCKKCRTAAVAYERTRIRRTAYGTWQPYVDAEPARQHVLELRNRGVGWKRIADIAGISYGGMTKLLYGETARRMAPSKRIRPETAQRILAVTYEQAVAPSAFVDAGPTWQHVQGLVALGYPMSWIARQIGQNGALQLRTDRIMHRSAQAVADLAARVGDTPGPSKRARKYAADRGWLTPMQQFAASLGDVDEPKARRRDILLEDAQWLIEGGMSVELAAERLGVRPDYLRELLDGKRGRKAS